ncbi:carbohydrate ABC transporter permease [Pseudonocardia sp. CA-107938]|uniref:carbohydrate ABC transporter permease n=1 Tax=Pseudonocardia sp. CA-107938 TaxID=3240021 RepID=UPI003D925247
MALASIQGAAAPARRRRTGRRHNGAAWLLVAPFVAVFGVFTAGPVLLSLFMGFTDVRSSDLQSPFAVNTVGFANYAALLADPTFLRSILNTLYFVVIGVPLTAGIGLVLAVALNTGINRLKGVFRVAFYAPVITNVVAVAIIWQYAFNASGPINQALATIGLAGPNWLGDERLAMPVVILLGVWKNFGTAMVLFLAGLQTIPTDVYEAAALDGAGRWRQLRSITLPLLRPTTLLVSVLITVFYLQVFDEPYLLTDGGPLGSTQSMALYTYHQFGFGNYGTAAASSYVLVVIVAVVSVIQFRSLRSKT